MATTYELAEDLYSIGIHGITGQEVDEGTLAAGTLIRGVTKQDGQFGPVYHFLASTDGGRLWYRQKSGTQPKFA